MLNSKGIAVIGGTGNRGFGLALRWAKSGERILIGSRQLAKAQAAAVRVREILGSPVDVEGMENAEAVSRSDVIVLTVPFAAQAPTLKGLKGIFKPGDTLVDVTVPLEAAVGGAVTRVVGVWAGSAAEQAAALVGKDVNVVSAFHHVGAAALEDSAKPVDSDIIVCGDDREE